MPSLMKQWMAEDVRQRVEKARDFLVVGLKPLSSEKTYQLRVKLRAAGGRIRVVHNRTSRQAMSGGQKDLSPFFRGQTAIATAEGDVIQIARALVVASRENSLELRGGWVDGEALDAAGVLALASSPDKQTLRGMILGGVMGPARGIAAALQAVGGGIARCLQARIDKSGEPVS